MREILKAKHGLGKHCENPPKDFLSEVDCEKERRLKFLKTARDEMKCGFKYKDWCSKEFRLFDSHNETLVRKLEQEQENVSQLMKGHQASERKVNWRKYLSCRKTSVFKELGWNNKKISYKRDICKSDSEAKEKIC